ncbi:MAG: aminomethyl-transferring glycine dehydrogenase subunit GcvPB [Candidatus Omnitrophica bacterium]|nr:aminomethyl-transferring glycine dehydrogenase subunit GcvPB [Candidatus Omnitrophota bacterium]MDD5430359.1 aminomethyl-transferring glycine dehydrogenase subunit GcvPB [Candidatus Omnitrophota bacterium]
MAEEKKNNAKEIPDKTGYIIAAGVPLINPGNIFPEGFLRKEIPISDSGELEVIRHYSRLSKNNFSLDANFYPLGSCTMKYNPKINEYLANLEGFCGIHPCQDQRDTQGALELLYNLQQVLCEITGMKRFSLEPSSGAQGEFTGISIIRKYHQVKGSKKTKIIVPDSAHGTNPATASMCGFETITVESDSRGLIDINKLEQLLDDDVAAVMLTNPNTLGLFEKNILEISRLIHSKGGLLYYDGANFNPLLGITKPSLMGFDVVHLNLHKTFSTPHGTGGPGAGALGVVEELADFLPVPIVVKKDQSFYFDYSLKHSIGRVRSFYGNFSVLVRAYAYILRLGAQGLLRAAQNSVINANYLRVKLQLLYEVAYPFICMHEVVLSAQRQKEKGASALDISKRLIDYGIHPPTMYFPLIVKEALMVEPTETENKKTLDNFIRIMVEINNEIDTDISKVKDAPHRTSVKRVDEVRAARFPDLKWSAEKSSKQ